MPLHFFNSAVITNSKLDSWTVTTSIIFIYFSKKKKALLVLIICTFWYNFAVQKLSFTEHATNVLGPRSVLQANLSDEIIYLSFYCHMHGTWVQQEVTQDSLHETQRMDITGSVTWGGVRVLVVYWLSFYTCQTMN